MGPANESPDRRAGLTVTDPSGHKKRIPLSKCPFTIGRQANNDLVLRDNRASRHHARIVEEQGAYFIEDLGSRHGVYVNGEKVTRRQLRNSDAIRFGIEDSYDLSFTLSSGELGRLLGQIPGSGFATSATTEGLAKLRAVVEVARALQSSLSVDEVLAAVVDAALTITGCERGFLLLRGDEGLSIRLARNADGISIAADELEVPTSIIDRALANRRELLSMEFAPAEFEGGPDNTVVRLELRGAVCLPLVRVRTVDLQETVTTSLNDTAGLIYLDSRHGAADLSSGNRELLQTLALEASTILENARLLEEERARQKLEEELRVARAIQQDLLPATLPSAGWFRAAGSSIPSRQVGGDYFDVIKVNAETWVTVVADVSGKGVSSALLAALLQGALIRFPETSAQIREMLAKLNHYLLERTEGEKYATLLYSIVTADGVVRWANAAHCPPVIVRRTGGLELLPATGMPVGLLEQASWEVETARLEPGEKMVAYSDGVTDARNEEGQFFEQRRLLDLLKRHSGLGCLDLHRMLIEELRAYTGDADQGDDITVLVVEYCPEL